MPPSPSTHPLNNHLQPTNRSSSSFPSFLVLAAAGSGPLSPSSSRNNKNNKQSGGTAPPPSLPFSLPLPPLTLTNGLLLANVLLFGAQVLTRDALTVAGAKVNALIYAGQWWRLITPAFLHGNLMHLAVNCYSLHNLAPMVETLSGSKRLLAVYLAAAVGGNVASLFGSAAPSLGASGAVFGVGGALGMYFYQNKEIWGKKADYMLQSLWQTLLMNVLYGLANPRIDNWGHVGGLVGGGGGGVVVGASVVGGVVEGWEKVFSG